MCWESSSICWVMLGGQESSFDGIYLLFPFSGGWRRSFGGQLRYLLPHRGHSFSCLWHLYPTETGIVSSEWAPCQSSRWAAAESCQKTVCASSFKYWRPGLPSESAVRAGHAKLFCLGLKDVSSLFQLGVINFESQTIGFHECGIQKLWWVKIRVSQKHK